MSKWQAMLAVGEFQIRWYGGNTFEIVDSEENAVHAWTQYKDDVQTRWTPSEAVQVMEDWLAENDQGDWTYAFMHMQ